MLTQPLLVAESDEKSSVDLESGENSSSASIFNNSQLNKVLLLLRALGVAILPSFVAHLFIHRPTSPGEVILPGSNHSNELDYLTGIRGFASLIVFFYHWGHGSYRGSMDYAYGDSTSPGPESSAPFHNHLLQLPIFRLLYAAEAMVALFFILSGYILSYGPAQQMRDKKPITILSTHAFRRAPRLFLPALAAVLLASFLQLVGAIPISKATTSSALGPTVENLLAFLRSLLISGVWTWDTVPDAGWSLHPHLWTVPTEWRCSMVLFAVLLSTSGRTPAVRLFIDIGIAIWCFSAARWDVALFIAGAALAEIRVRREWHLVSRIQDSRTTRRQAAWKLFRTLVLTGVFLLGMLLAGYPRKPPSASTPIYGPLSLLVGADENGRRVWYALGAIGILGALDSLPGLQKVFRSRVALYLGKISYALYLVHGLLIRSVGQRILNTVWRAGSGGSGGEPWDSGVKFGLASLLFIPVVIWAADLFERGIERRLVALTKRI